MRSALLVANADAGGSEKDRVDAAADRLGREGVDVDVVTSEGPDSLDRILAGRRDRDIIVAGGDGSLHTIVAALARRHELAGPTLGLIPLGTGNDFARSVGIPLDADAAARLFAHGTARQLDLLVDSDDGVVVNAVNLGVGANATRRAKALKRRFGRAAYVAGAAVAGLTTKGDLLRVEADGEILADGSVRVLQVGIGNGRFVGGGTPLLPQAVPSDGRVDVVVSMAVGPVRRFGYALEVKLRRHVHRRDVRSARAQVVRVSGDPYWCSADGELSGPIADRTWSVRPGALTMVLPGDDASDL
jgi:YegS/Rv2252/BmrU family lipid kinase